MIHRVYSGRGELPVLGSFDVVTAVWLLGYAPGVEALDFMLGKLVANLAPGGTFVVLVPNPEIDWDGLDILPAYGISATRTAESLGRQGYAVHIPGDPPIDFEGFTWPPGAIESALDRAGLTDVRRVPTTITDDLIAEKGAAYWTPLLSNPTFAVYTATR
ncbi:hypothetical protein GCM10009682_43050 [Luedemannella flava]|uniref:Uncharacterized protein n=1 Tax=Luedemannella flava TaxID=349316 RepID=A0ABN2MC55_9ACTN